MRNIALCVFQERKHPGTSWDLRTACVLCFLEQSMGGTDLGWGWKSSRDGYYMCVCAAMENGVYTLF
jgi:hypothetical protein